MIGTSLGPYKIVEQLGAGGMGEVYLAEDTRLGRKVAVKVLPPEFASDSERLARFEQEAKAAAALNHPHIAAVFDVGLEGEGDVATHYMVQEYLSGQSLRQRLDRGALPLTQALDLAIEVAQALIAAHRAGIIHRDLKPDNIFITEEGHAKVLDFGLAKLTEMAAPMSPGTSAGTALAGVSKSPTMLGTVAGQIMGTAGYMAPEQVHGDGNIDRRADLFAFGCVLYEMVSGRQPFAGKSVLDTLHRIADEEPTSLREQPVALPVQLHWIIAKSLAKDPAKRYQDADDLAVDLKALASDVESGGALAASPAGPDAVAAPGPASGVPAKIALPAALMIALLAALAGGLLSRGESPERVVSTFAIDVSELGPIPRGGGQAVAISPDGKHIVVRVESGLYHRPIDRLELVRLSGTEGGARPVFSPDNEWVVFNSGGKLRKVALSGGDPFELCDAPGSPYPDWGDDDTIIFVRDRSLYTVPAAGGDPQLAAAPDADRGEESYYRPFFLPGSGAVLLEVRGVDGSNAIGVLSLDSGEIHQIAAEGTDPAYVSTGHVVYARGTTLFAVPFDAERLEVLGQPTPVLQGVRTEGGGATQVALADNGTLVYVAGGAQDRGGSMLWVDRDGGVEPLPFEPARFDSPRLSPDGARVALEVLEEENHIWVYDLAVGSSQRLTFEGSNRDPVWSHDGEWIYFSSNRSGNIDIWRKPARRRGDAEPVLQGEAIQSPRSMSVDGSRLLYATGDGHEIGVLELGDEPVSETLVRSTDIVVDPAISPDGRLLAFQSNESGRFDVIVQELSSGDFWTVSNAGGGSPRWSRDGTRLFYRTSDGVSMVEVTADAGFPFSRPVVFTEARGDFDVSPGGDRLLMVTREDLLNAELNAPQVNVVLNWSEQLKATVPTGRIP